MCLLRPLFVTSLTRTWDSCSRSTKSTLITALWSTSSAMSPERNYTLLSLLLSYTVIPVLHLEWDGGWARQQFFVFLPNFDWFPQRWRWGPLDQIWHQCSDERCRRLRQAGKANAQGDLAALPCTSWFRRVLMCTNNYIMKGVQNLSV